MENEDMADLVASGDVETVKAKIRAKYGFTPPDSYVVDLIQFVNDVLNGDTGEEEDADSSYSDDDGDDYNDVSEE